jgi:glycerophosphoryl diester phosphodiesterase
MTKHPLLLGHRGARANKSFPENTLESFDQALTDGCDGFEFDVRLTADHKAIIHHNSKIKRKEIARTNVADLHLPLLETILERYAHRAFLDIELKVPGLEKVTAQLLQKHPLTHGGVVSSFLPELLQAFSPLAPAIPLGLISETKRQLPCWRTLPIQYVIPHGKLITRKLIAELHEAEKKILVWTVNRREEMQKFANWKVEGIISDNTELLAKTLSPQAKPR